MSLHNVVSRNIFKKKQHKRDLCEFLNNLKMKNLLLIAALVGGMAFAHADDGKKGKKACATKSGNKSCCKEKKSCCKSKKACTTPSTPSTPKN